MRQFIFRAWDKDNKKMIYPPGPCDSDLGPYSVTFDGRTYIDGRYQDLIYMPWTGLITQEADYIYEGDILGGQWNCGYILFCEECKSLQYHVFNECLACSGDFHWDDIVDDDGTFEIIGNIYENPELLEHAI